jgi:hypothetical protein
MDDKEIEAEIMEKEKSKEKYDDAVAAQNTAVKVDYDEKSPNVINMDVGGLQPGKKAEIEIEILSKCEVYKHGFYTFAFPLQFLSMSLFDKSNLVDEKVALTINGSLKSLSTITNVHSSHSCDYECSSDKKEVKFCNFEVSSVGNLVISYSSDQIREPQIKLEECKKFGGEVAA